MYWWPLPYLPPKRNFSIFLLSVSTNFENKLKFLPKTKASWNLNKKEHSNLSSGISEFPRKTNFQRIIIEKEIEKPPPSKQTRPQFYSTFDFDHVRPENETTNREFSQNTTCISMRCAKEIKPLGREKSLTQSYFRGTGSKTSFSISTR